MKKVVVGISIVLLLLIGWKVLSGFASRPTFPTLVVGDQKLHVELAQTPEQLTKGLGDRDHIGSEGMLFLLPGRQMATFWMKDMRFGLDFVWIAAGKVVDLTPNVPAELGVSDVNLHVYSPHTPVDEVLELPLGDISRRHIQIGDDATLGQASH